MRRTVSPPPAIERERQNTDWSTFEILISRSAEVKRQLIFWFLLKFVDPYTITLTRASSHFNISTFLHWVCIAGLPGIGSHPITQDLLDRSRRSMHQLIQRMWFHYTFGKWRPCVISVTFKGQGVTFPIAAMKKSDPLIGNHPITRDLLDGLRSIMHQSIQRVQFHKPFWRWRPWVNSMTFKGQRANFLITEKYKNDPLTYEGHKDHPRSPSSKRLVKSHTLNRLVHRSSRSVQ